MFVAIALDLEYKAFIIYVVALSINLGDEIYHLKRALIAHLNADKALTKVSNKYVDFSNVFSSKLIAKISKQIKIINDIIELVYN